MQVIKTLDPKQPATAAPDVQALRNQLTEKDRKIQHLEVLTLLNLKKLLKSRFHA